MITAELNSRVRTAVTVQMIDRWLKKVDRVIRRKEKLLISVAIVGRAEMKRLNSAYRGKKIATNVLSFVEAETSRRQAGYLGEIILCQPVIVSEARTYKHTGSAYFEYLFVHGVLHLLGFDHTRTVAAKKMERLEQKILGG